LVPSEGPLISDQLRRAGYFSTYIYLLLAHHHPSRPLLTAYLTPSRCLRRQSSALPGRLR
jgi:hypothetical protein